MAVGDLIPSGYYAFLNDLKNRIKVAQTTAIFAVNKELIRLYWEIGKSIVIKQKEMGWGKAIVQRVSQDIQNAFPGVSGFSPQNIWYMRSFYLAWTEEVIELQQAVGELDGENLPQVVGEIPWGHNLQLLAKLNDPVIRLWYARQSHVNGWSRAILVHQIQTKLYERQGQVLSNFEDTLPAPHSDLAQQALKDTYILDFITLSPAAREKDLQQALLLHIKSFLLELGRGFALYGENYHLVVSGQDYYLDLLFYHHQLRCFVVIDLKMDEFKPEHAGKMNFYLTAMDAQLKHSDDQPSIGLIICREKNRLVVEYALRDLKKPMGVAEWKVQLTASLPAEYTGSLPSPEEFDADFCSEEENPADASKES